EPQSTENINLESYGLGAVPLKSEEEQSTEESLENETVAASASAAGDSETPGEEPEFEPVENTEPWYEEARDRKKRKWLWLILLLIPLIGAGIYLWMANDKTEPDTIKVRTETPMNNEEPVTEENLPVSPPADSVEQEIQSAMDTAEGIEKDSGYFLITGSFKEEENVDDFMQELKNQGYDPFHLGKKGNFHLVGIRRYNTLDEAYSAQIKFLEENPESGAWVFYEE
ncbi:MAG: SPOR domain-containing protein, partial [Prolixibacteraceae bacterium]